MLKLFSILLGISFFSTILLGNKINCLDVWKKIQSDGKNLNSEFLDLKENINNNCSLNFNFIYKEKVCFLLSKKNQINNENYIKFSSYYKKLKNIKNNLNIIHNNCSLEQGQKIAFIKLNELNDFINEDFLPFEREFNFCFSNIKLLKKNICNYL